MMNNTVMKRFTSLGALSAMIATLLGAFAAHGLKPQFSEYQMHVFQTGVFYQFIHSLALMFIGIILWQLNNRLLRIAGWLFGAGVVMFSGSLYLMSLIPIQGLGVVTPIGGACFLFGWLFLVAGIHRPNQV